MNNLTTLLSELASQGIRLKLTDGKLSILSDSPASAELKARLREHKTEIIALLEKQQAQESNTFVVTEAPSDVLVPASEAQQGLWFIDKLVGSKQYHTGMQLGFEGCLDIEVLARAFRQLCQRQAILRSGFTEQDGRAFIVADAYDPRLEFVNLKGHSGLQTELVAIWQKLNDTPFDLTKDPLIRIAAVQWQAERFTLFICIHHIISDGWSMDVLLADLAALYRNELNHNQSLEPLPIQYRDFAHWQASEPVQHSYKESVRFWQSQLNDIGALDLHTEYPRPSVMDYRAGHSAVTLSEALSKQLSNVAKELKTSPFVVFMSAYQVFLSLLCRQSRFVVGTSSANRPNPDTHGLVGFFSELLCIPADLSGIEYGASFAQLVTQLQARYVTLLNHQHVPFHKIVETLGVDRSANRPAVFQTNLVFQDTSEGSQESSTAELFPGCQFASAWPEQMDAATTANALYELTLNVSRRNEMWQLEFEYQQALFSVPSIARLAEQFVHVLEQLGNKYQQPINSLKLTSLKEQAQLFALNTSSPLDSPEKQQNIAAEFAQVCARSPSSPAVHDQTGSLSYRELDEQASQVARLLVENGVQIGDSVGICLPRGKEWVVAMLAVVKAGACYVPLDMDSPQQRLEHILTDSAIHTLICNESALDVLPVSTIQFINQINLDDLEQIAQVSQASFAVSVSPLVPAYTIYTSGSTGTPKGVSINQQNILELVKEPHYIKHDANLHTVQAANPVFDATTFEVWAPLLNGGQVTVVDKYTLLDSQAFTARLIEQKVNTLFVTTALFNTLSKETPHLFPQLDTVLFGGEAVDCARVEWVLEHAAPRQLLHVYGPTETTTFSSWHHITQVTKTVPIGRGLAGNELFVVDETLSLLPQGAVGELCIAGNSLSAGYVHQPSLTAQQFRPNPFGEKGERLYLTGDLVRWNSSGELEYIGRKDQQVKIRGHRIELPEIEACLRQIEGIDEAYVRVEKNLESVRIEAYFSLCDATTTGRFTPQFLHQQLSSMLPSYMVPGAYCYVTKLPLNANGKVDGRALPKIEQSHLPTAQSYQAPIGNVEQSLAKIWQALLGVERVSRDDHFFNLGGNSLLATQVIGRLQSELSTSVSIASLFEKPVLQELAKVVEQTLNNGNAVAVKFAQSDASSASNLSFSQQRMWFQDALEGASSLYNMPSVITLKGHLDIASLERALGYLVERHEILKTYYFVQDQKPQQRVIPNYQFELKTHDFSHEPNKIADYIATFRKQVFDLSKGPLFVAELISQSPSSHLLLLNMHHSISDGWSMAILIDELRESYNAFHNGLQVNLPPLAIQYRDFANWQQTHANVIQEKESAFWQNKLAGLPPLLSLPTDFPRPAKQTYRVSEVGVSIPKSVLVAIEQLSKANQASVFMVLQAVLHVLLSRVANSTDIAIGSPVAGRSLSPELESLIGFFVNTVVFRETISENVTFTDLLQQVRQHTLEVYQHQNIAFDQVVELVQPQRSMSYSPLVQVMLALQNTKEGRLELDGLEIGSLPQGTEQSPFDLTFNLIPHGDGLAAYLVYNTDLYLEQSAQSLIDSFAHLLQSLVERPNKRLKEHSILSSEQTRKVLSASQSKAPELSHSVLDFIAYWVATEPSLPALIRDECTLDYRTLWNQAKQVAIQLQAYNLPANSVVGLNITPSIEMVAGLLGTWIAGHAYVPIDTTWPTERLQQVMDECAVTVYLTFDESLALRDFENLNVINISSLSLQDCELTLPPYHPQRLAYVIYTSGTTGRPKGVRVPHSGLASLAHSDRTMMGIKSGEKVAHFVSMTFDAGLAHLLMGLVSGACVYLYDKAQLNQGDGLVGLLAKDEINFIASPVSLLASQPHSQLPHLKAIIVGAEAVGAELVATWQPGRKMFNCYGPTETTICSTFSALQVGEKPLIGKPVAGDKVYILDGNLQPQPVGAIGELYIGGIALAHGYHQRAALTASAFLPDPFGTAGERMYKTGDIARFTANGAIDYLGRNDNQIKIRGFRIELEEIEARLKQASSAIEQACALVYEHQQHKELVVFYSSKAQQTLSDVELLAFLREVLPFYMVPNHLWYCQTMPLTSSGKIDKSKLLAQVPELREQTTSQQEPITDSEKLLARLWGGLLARQNISRHDNFFALGGHSLLTTRLQENIASETGIQLPLEQIYNAKHLAEMASLLDELHSESVKLEELDSAELMAQIEQMSEEEIEQLLAQQEVEGAV